MTNQKGFSLVEISIVLVIIGLLLGGALKGQELIENAKITKLYKDFQGIKTAFYAYKDAYGVYPGNYSEVTRRVTSEDQFWDDLKASGFISSKKNPYSKDYKIPPAPPVFSISGENFSATYSVSSPFEAADPSTIDGVCTQVPDAMIGKYLDDRYDDGQNQTGDIVFTLDISELAPSIADVPPLSPAYLFSFNTYESYYKTMPGWVCLRLD
ncbi:MAG: prepilin-type N-terminal cleavage/methylation domain-containing protein [Thiomicrorhabdus sp.]|nr:prepilin-type N-terminal cleavage/methylation domain-containing protein [Thiomicrorhabdus sp.]